jgi:hypothetical protein
MTAAKAEATKKKHTFVHDGENYSIATTKEWGIDVIEAIEDEKIVSAIRAILGDKQWATFKNKPRTVDDLNSLFESISKAAGLQGNS